MKIRAYLQSLVTIALLFAISITCTSAIDTTFTAANPGEKRMRENFKKFRVRFNFA